MSDVAIVLLGLLTILIGAPVMVLVHLFITWLCEGNHRWVNKDGWYDKDD